MVSNKTLASLLVLTIVVSLGGTMISLNRLGDYSVVLTGKATEGQGTASLEIQTQTAIEITQASINFGAGYVNTTGNNSAWCAMETDAGTTSDDCVTLASPGANTGFEIMNTGNTNVSLNVTVNTDAASLIGGSSPELQFKASNKEANSCSNLGYTSWEEVTASTNYVICNGLNFNFGFSSNEMYLDVRVKIPGDAPPTGGSSSATFTFTASDT